jgi:hypothetical protein
MSVFIWDPAGMRHRFTLFWLEEMSVMSGKGLQ